MTVTSSTFSRTLKGAATAMIEALKRLAVRRCRLSIGPLPDLGVAKDKEAYQWSQNLCKLSPSSELYRLGAMTLLARLQVVSTRTRQIALRVLVLGVLASLFCWQFLPRRSEYAVFRILVVNNLLELNKAVCLPFSREV